VTCDPVCTLRLFYMTYDQPSHSSTFWVLGNLLLNITHDNKLCIQFKLFLLGGILFL